MNAESVLITAYESAGSVGVGCEARDTTFIEILRAFRRSGGLARDSEVLLMDHKKGNPCGNACRPANAICFEWGGSLWMPRFQFDPADMSMRPGPAKVIGELQDVFEGWEMATWFANPNLWIGGHKPVDLIDECLDSVLGAARADRFIAAG